MVLSAQLRTVVTASVWPRPLNPGSYVQANVRAAVAVDEHCNGAASSLSCECREGGRVQMFNVERVECRRSEAFDAKLDLPHARLRKSGPRIRLRRRKHLCPGRVVVLRRMNSVITPVLTLYGRLSQCNMTRDHSSPNP